MRRAVGTGRLVSASPIWTDFDGTPLKDDMHFQAIIIIIALTYMTLFTFQDLFQAHYI